MQWCKGNTCAFFTVRVAKHLEQVAQTGCRISILWDIQETPGQWALGDPAGVGPLEFQLQPFCDPFASKPLGTSLIKARRHLKSGTFEPCCDALVCFLLSTSEQAHETQAQQQIHSDIWRNWPLSAQHSTR